MAEKAETPPGECVVCGKMCLNRCTDCVKAGIKFMYFCTVEHKKLVFDFHKRVCGKSQFTWPGFSRKEIKKIESFRKGGFKTTGILDQAIEIRKSQGREDESREAALLALVNELKEPPRGNLLSEFQSRSVVKIRRELLAEVLAQANVTSQITPPESLLMTTLAVSMEHAPLDFAIYQQEKFLFSGFASSPHLYGDWWNELQHRIVIDLALINLPADSPDAQMTIHSWRLDNHERFDRFLAETVSKTHPVEAETLAKTWIMYSILLYPQTP